MLDPDSYVRMATSAVSKRKSAEQSRGKRLVEKRASSAWRVRGKRERMRVTVQPHVSRHSRFNLFRQKWEANTGCGSLSAMRPFCRCLWRVVFIAKLFLVIVCADAPARTGQPVGSYVAPFMITDIPVHISHSLILFRDYYCSLVLIPSDCTRYLVYIPLVLDDNITQLCLLLIFLVLGQARPASPIMMHDARPVRATTTSQHPPPAF